MPGRTGPRTSAAHGSVTWQHEQRGHSAHECHHRARSDKHRTIERHRGKTALERIWKPKSRNSQSLSEYLPKGSHLANCFRGQSKLKHACEGRPRPLLPARVSRQAQVFTRCAIPPNAMIRTSPQPSLEMFCNRSPGPTLQIR